MGKKTMKKILASIKRADQDFNMIKEGDKIALGISGGKDSLVLLKALSLYRYMSKVKYELEAITIDMGFEKIDWSPIEKYCDDLGLAYSVKNTDISSIVFDIRNEKNPCSLCSKLRKGALNNLAIERGCRTIALGHHRDDIIETFFLSMFYEARFKTIKAKTYLDRKDISLIRPLIYVLEEDIENLVRYEKLPIIKNPCPVDGATKREDIKKLLRTLSQDIPQVQEQIFSAISKSSILKESTS